MEGSSFLTSLHGKLLSSSDDTIEFAIQGFTSLPFQERRELFSGVFSGELRLTYLWLMSALLGLPFARRRALWALSEMTSSPWEGLENDPNVNNLMCDTLWRLVHSSAYGQLKDKWDWEKILKRLACTSPVAAQALETVRGTEISCGRRPLVKSIEEYVIGDSGDCQEEQIGADDLTVGQQKALNDIYTWVNVLPTLSCLCLHGPSGCGKTTVIHRAHQVAAADRDLVTLHIDDSTDPKSLIGGFQQVPNKPGRFEWQMGVLAKAMVEGSWVVIEDIDKVSSDVLAILPSPSDNSDAGYLVLEQNTTLRIHPDFVLIGTVSSCNQSSTMGSSLDLLLATSTSLQTWTHVEMPSMTGDEMEKYIAAKVLAFPAWGKAVSEAYSKVNAAMEDEGVSRKLTPKDFSRAVERLAPLSTRWPHRWPLAENTRMRISREMYAVWVAHVYDGDARRKIYGALRESLGLPSGAAGSDNAPEVTLDRSNVSIGTDVEPLPRKHLDDLEGDERAVLEEYSLTSVHRRLLEFLAKCVVYNEPALLVGDTGCGKTTTVQCLARMLNRELMVYNFSDQSEAQELIGGLKPLPIDADDLIKRWHVLMDKTFSKKSNAALAAHVDKVAKKKGGAKALGIIAETARKAISAGREEEEWKKLAQECKAAVETKVEVGLVSLRFEFVEGQLLTALRTGAWLVLDEINLAPGDMLQRIAGLLEQGASTEEHPLYFDVHEAGGSGLKIPIHPDFRLFACMNPSHLGPAKKPLPAGIRARFCEYYVDEVVEDADLIQLVSDGLSRNLPNPPSEAVVRVYKTVREMAADGQLSDGQGGKPVFSLRSLSRALRFARTFVRSPKYRHHDGGIEAVREGLAVTFAGVLSESSEAKVMEEINRLLPGPSKVVKRIGQAAGSLDAVVERDAVCIEGYWVARGPKEIDAQRLLAEFCVTESARRNLRKVLRCVSGGKVVRPPVLLEGPTGAGKTSLVKFVAAMTGHECIRINNHEHTDLQEYLGQHVYDHGVLKFEEGPLVKACRSGAWVVLDELNLAPSEVLEGINRLLDDNREIHIAETNTTVVPDPDFVVFATQNPAGGDYGGRKQLSRALRNRFTTMWIDSLSSEELRAILQHKCQLAPSIASGMVKVYESLRAHKNVDALLAGGGSELITIRDILRWAHRRPGTMQECGLEGWCLLGERLRHEDQRVEVAKALVTHCRTYGVTVESYLDLDYREDPYVAEIKKGQWGTGLVWTETMCRMIALVSRCAKYGESALLVGETGTGKTTVVQTVADFHGINLEIVNCHQHTEPADFLGAMRPAAGRRDVRGLIMAKARRMCELVGREMGEEPATTVRSIVVDYSLEDQDEVEENASPKRARVRSELRALWREIGDLRGEVNHETEHDLFAWQDGPVTRAMRGEGHWVLLDEASLATDAVLERLNSVLEAGERSVMLAEKPGGEVVVGGEKFSLMMTMNPGGDFGKRELSPALRSRMTEIWIKGLDYSDENEDSEASRLIRNLLSDEAKPLAGSIRRAVAWVMEEIPAQVLPMSIRNVGLWVTACNELVGMSLGERFLHGGTMTIVDALMDSPELQRKAMRMLEGYAPEGTDLGSFGEDGYEWVRDAVRRSDSDGLGPFHFPPVSSGSTISPVAFDFAAPTTALNLGRILRGITVGKEQTEIADLVGQFLPTAGQGGDGGHEVSFAWSDGVLLSALRRDNCWVLLDELNLAPQPVLEGLNSLLDHRRELVVPETGEKVRAKPGSFQLFATQNRMVDGGGRKGLPKSFLNRFVKIAVSELTAKDSESICMRLFGEELWPVVCQGAVESVRAAGEMQFKGGSGWEWNLRDVLRVSSSVQAGKVEQLSPALQCYLLLSCRLQTAEDREALRSVIWSAAKDPRWTAGCDVEDVDVGSMLIRVAEAFKSSAKAGFGVTDTDVLQSQSFGLSAGSAAVLNSWPVLMVGDGGTGRRKLVEVLAAVAGVKLVSIRMHAQMDANDLVGQFVQRPEGGFQWVDSPLVCALKSGDWVLFTSVEQCPSAVVDRLNALLEVGGRLQVPERGRANPEDLTVTPHPGCRLFFTADARHAHLVSNPLRNRCVEIFVGSSAGTADLERVCMAASGGLVDSVEEMQDCKKFQVVAREASRQAALGRGFRGEASEIGQLKPLFAEQSIVAKTIGAAKMCAEEGPEGECYAYRWMIESTLGTSWDIESRLEALPEEVTIDPAVLRNMKAICPSDRRWVVMTYMRVAPREGSLLYQLEHPEDAAELALLSGRRLQLMKRAQRVAGEVPTDPRVMPYYCRLMKVLDSYDQLSSQAETSLIVFLDEYERTVRSPSDRSTRPPEAAVACPVHLPMFGSASESAMELVLEVAIRNISLAYQSTSGDRRAQTLGDILAQVRSLAVLNRRARKGDEDSREKLQKLQVVLAETVASIVDSARQHREETAVADEVSKRPVWPAEILRCAGEISASRFDELELPCPWPVVDGLAMQTEAAWSTGSIPGDLAAVEGLFSRLAQRSPEGLIRAHGGWTTILGASVAEAVLRWPISDVPEAANLAKYIREIVPSAAKSEEQASVECADVMEKCCRASGDLPQFAGSVGRFGEALEGETDPYARLGLAAAWHLTLGAGILHLETDPTESRSAWCINAHRFITDLDKELDVRQRCLDLAAVGAGGIASLRRAVKKLSESVGEVENTLCVREVPETKPDAIEEFVWETSGLGEINRDEANYRELRTLVHEFVDSVVGPLMADDRWRQEGLELDEAMVLAQSAASIAESLMTGFPAHGDITRPLALDCLAVASSAAAITMRNKENGRGAPHVKSELNRVHLPLRAASLSTEESEDLAYDPTTASLALRAFGVARSQNNRVDDGRWTAIGHVDALVSEFERLEEEEAAAKDEGMIRQNEVTFIERMRELTSEDDNDLEKLQQEYNVKLFEDASHSRVIRQLESDDVMADIGRPVESEATDVEVEEQVNRDGLGSTADATRALDGISGLLVQAITDDDGTESDGLMDELIGEAWRDLLGSLKEDEVVTGKSGAPGGVTIGKWINDDGMPIVLGRLNRLTRDLDKRVEAEEMMPSVEKEEKEVEDADEGIEENEDMSVEELEALERRRLKREGELKVRLRDVINRKGARATEKLSFYLESADGRALDLLNSHFVHPLTLLLHHLEAINRAIPEGHPAVDACLRAVRKFLDSCTLGSTSPMSALLMLEECLDRYDALVRAVPSHLLKAGAGAVTSVRRSVATFRAMQIASWRDLRASREAFWRSKARGRWFARLWSAAKSTKLEGAEDRLKAELFDTGMRFVRTSPLVQFSERVAIIKTVGELLNVPVLQHLHGMAMVWLPYVDKQMEIHRKALEKEVKELIQCARWDLGPSANHAAFRDMTKRAHKQLAKAARMFDSAVLAPTDPILAAVTLTPPLRVGQEMKCRELCEALSDTKAFLMGENPAQAKRRQMIQLKDYIVEEVPVPPGSPATIDLSTEVMAGSPLVREEGSDMKLSRTFNICLHEWLKLSSLHKAPPSMDLPMDQLNWWMQRVVQLFHDTLNTAGRRRWLKSVDEAMSIVDETDSIVVEGQADVISLVTLLDSAVNESVAQLSAVSSKPLAPIPTVVKDSLDSMCPEIEQITSRLDGGEESNSLLVRGEWIEQLKGAARSMVEYLRSPACLSLIPRLAEVATELSSCVDALVIKLCPIGCDEVSAADLSKAISGELPYDGPQASEALKNLREGRISGGMAMTPSSELDGELESSLIGLHAMIKFVCHLHQEGLSLSEGEDAEGGEGREGTTDWQQGTGLGDGSGARDVSDEIEDKNMFDTLQEEKKEQAQEQQQPPQDSEEDKSKGVEVGDIMDVDGPEENVQREPNEDEKEDKENDDMDREMGDVDLKEGGEIEQKQKGPEEEEDNDEGSDSEDDENAEKKQDENIETKGGEKQAETDVVAAEEEGEGEADEEQKNGENEKNSEEGDEKADDGDENGEDDGEGSINEESGDEEDEAFEASLAKAKEDQESGEEGEDGENARQDGEADEDDMDLDDDMALDGDVGGDSDDAVTDDEEDADLDDEDAKSADTAPEDETEKLNSIEAAEDQDTLMENAAEAAPQPQRNAASSEDEEGAQGEELTGGRDNDAHNEDEPTRDQPQGAEDAGRDDEGATVRESGPQGKSSKEQKKKAPPAPPNPLKDSVDEVEKWLKRIQLVDEDENGDEEEGQGEGESEEEQQGLNKDAAQDESSKLEGVAEATGDSAEHAGELEREDEEEDEGETDEMDVDENEDESAENKDGLGPAPHKSPEDKTSKEQKKSEDVSEEKDATLKEDRPANGKSHAAPRSEISKNTQALTAMAEEDDGDVEMRSGEGQEDIIYNAGGEGDVSNERLQQIDRLSTSVCSELTERLRMVLEPTKRGGMQGDYKTGKRLNMRKVLAWVASDYRKDRIWLRRNKPSKREHNVIVCLDNTKSMRSNESGELSLCAVYAITQAMSRLEIGTVGVSSFGSSVRPLRTLASPAPLSLPELLQHFNFDEESAGSMSRSLPAVLDDCDEQFSHVVGEDYKQACLAVVVTDGRFNKEAVRHSVQNMLSKNRLPVLIIVDESADSGRSIYNLKEVIRDPTGRSRMAPFLSNKDFPFPFYAVIQDVSQLPNVLSDVIKQWVEVTATR
ncbi:AAA ATPase midasin [Perkinsus chesapeaki]|uniref:Midasin n=1 Tax=Perkinsus chesapeaki TaxID=330153 RepID=A0A7J6MKT7_PERCH|nr:AAA ATPase midasin [Perkinsus chesapeaki]